jgi:hypothetical protein
MKFDKLTTDRIVSLSAMAVSIGSLFIIVYQTYLTRQAQHASVLPYLYFSLSANDEGVAVRVTNSGIGPALVDDVRIHYQGRDIASDPYDFYLSLQPDASKLALGVDKVQPGRLIPAGATIQMLAGRPADSGPMLSEFLRLFDIAEVPKSWYLNSGVSGGEKAVIEIRFSSVYGDQWRIRSDRIVPERL